MPDPQPLRKPSGWLATLIPWGGLVAAVLVLYVPAIDGGMIWDDAGIYIVNNPLLREPDGIVRFWFTKEPVDYYPLAYTTFWFEYQIAGERTRLYHLTNVVLHLATTWVLFLLLRRLGVPWPWLVCLLFAVHPIQAESVAWISQRKTLLGTLFGFAAAYEYLGERKRGFVQRLRGPLWFFLSLAGKPVLITLPVWLAAYQWFRGERNWRTILVRTGPYALLSLVFGLVGIAYQQKAIAGFDVRGQDFLTRIASLGWAAWFYVGQTFRIDAMNFVYPRWEIDGGSLAAWLPNAAVVLALFVGLRWRHRLGLFPFAAWSTYLLTMLPSLGIADVFYWRYSFVGDHYVYQSFPSLLALIAWSAQLLAKQTATMRRIAYAGAGCFVAAACCFTWQRAYAYQSEERLWLDALQRNPRAFLAMTCLGGIRHAQGRPFEASVLLKQSVELVPDFYEAWWGLGDLACEREDWIAAREAYEQVRRLAPPVADEYLYATIGVGKSAFQLGRLEEAEPLLLEADAKLADTLAASNLAKAGSSRCVTLAYLSAVAGRRNETARQGALKAQADLLAAKSPEARLELAQAWDELGDTEAAGRLWNQILADKPTKPTVFADAGLSALRGGDARRAVELLQEAVRREPTNVTMRSSLGIAFMSLEQPTAALEQFREATRLAPDDARMHSNLGLAYTLIKRPAEAIAAFRSVQRLEPNDVASKRDLAWLLATTEPAGPHTAEEAVRLARDCCALTGWNHPAALDTLGAALANQGRFVEAAETADRAVAAARNAGANADQLQPLLGRAELYRRGQAYREP